jgi:two-component system chemotaxis response regulator CheY
MLIRYEVGMTRRSETYTLLQGAGMSASDLKAFIIDDQKTMRSIVRGLLHQLGITDVTEAENGKSAFEMLKRAAAPPDFILCDLYMENGDGLEFINSLRRDETTKLQHIPVILLTGEHDKLLLEVSQQIGAVVVLYKPCGIKELASAISKVVGFNLPLMRERVT